MALDTDKIDDAVLALLYLTRPPDPQPCGGVDRNFSSLSSGRRDQRSPSHEGVDRNSLNPVAQAHALVLELLGQARPLAELDHGFPATLPPKSLAAI